MRRESNINPTCHSALGLACSTYQQLQVGGGEVKRKEGNREEERVEQWTDGRIRGWIDV